MRFKTIYDFISLVDKCPFCGDELTVKLNGNNDIGMSPHTKLNYLEFPTEPSDYNFEYQLYGKTYYLKLKEEQFSCWVCENPGKYENKVFSANIYNNQLTYGLTENVQKILLNYKMAILKQCSNKECLKSGLQYRYQSTHLLLGSLTRTIYPLSIAVEAVTIKINGKKVSLMSSLDAPNTYLLNNNSVMVTLPKLEIYKMLNKDSLIKKIKTYILFS